MWPDEGLAGGMAGESNTSGVIIALSFVYPGPTCGTIEAGTKGATAMPMTKVIHSRIDEPALAQARQAHPDLAGLDPSRLIRVALAVLAGHGVTDAIEASKGGPRGPKPKADRERESAGVAA